jgi:hypothetical protein
VKQKISELTIKINEIKNKSIQSEKVVTDICTGIKSLDHAKRNLLQTITTMKRLSMFCTFTLYI